MKDFKEIRFVVCDPGDPSAGIPSSSNEFVFACEDEEDMSWMDEKEEKEFIDGLKEFIALWFLESQNPKYVIEKEQYLKAMHAEEEFERSIDKSLEHPEPVEVEDININYQYDDVDYFRERNRKILSKINGAGVKA